MIVETGPDPDAVVRWRRIDLKHVVAERFGADYRERHETGVVAPKPLKCPKHGQF